MSIVSSLKPEYFDYSAEDDTYTTEWAELRHRFSQPVSLNRAITILGESGNRHFVLDRTDKSGGDIMGWWYRELGGTGKVLIIND